MHVREQHGDSEGHNLLGPQVIAFEDPEPEPEFDPPFWPHTPTTARKAEIAKQKL